MSQGKGIGGHHRAYKGNSDDWITPKYILDALGPFDLDPCVCTPQPWDTAARSYAREDDGLSQEWFGTVWMNPPYGPQTTKWLERLAQHSNGIALIFARTETQMFFDHVWNKSQSLLFLKGRVYFHYPDGTRASHNSGGPSVLVAYGEQCSSRLSGCGLEGAFVEL